MDILRSSSYPAVKPIRLSELLNKRKSSLPLPDVRYVKLSDDQVFVDASTAWIVMNDVRTDLKLSEINNNKAPKVTERRNSRQKVNTSPTRTKAITSAKTGVGNVPTVAVKKLNGTHISRPIHLELDDTSELVISIHDDHFGNRGVNNDAMSDVTSVSSPMSDDGATSDVAISPTDTFASDGEFEQYENAKLKGL